MRKIIITIVVLGILGALYGWFFVYNKPHKNFEDARVDMALPATKLYNEYVSGTGNQYNGKVLKLTGTVKKMDDEDSLITLVFVFNEGMFGDEGIRCTFLPKYNPKLKSFSYPKQMQIKGFCAGYNGTDVVMEYCSLIK